MVISSSIATLRWKYDVFLSFRGETRKNFTDHLYTALKENGINAFRDEESLEKGNSVSTDISKAIEESRFAIIVFSSDYASSTWCLNELAKIVKCKKKMGLIAFPVFYNVDPSDLRKQTGPFQIASAKHQHGQMWNFFMNFCKCHFYHVDPNQRVKKWRDALRVMANIAGWDTKDRHEAKLIREIVEKIQQLRDAPPRATKGQFWELFSQFIKASFKKKKN